MPSVNVTLNSGFQMPLLGLGTALGAAAVQASAEAAARGEPQPVSEEVKQAVKHAVTIGYRHIDTAFVYGVEETIGIALQELFAEGVVSRGDMFITTKLFNTFHRPDDVEPACRASLAALQLDYVDLYLMHWPQAFQNIPEMGLFPKDDEGNVLYDVQTTPTETWLAMETLVGLGLCRSIGVSNFNEAQMNDLYTAAAIMPACNQVEGHPYCTQLPLLAKCQEYGVALTAYSPLGGP